MNDTFNWDDVISDDGAQREHLIIRGEHDFKVVEFKRGTYGGSAKLPACNQAELTLEATTEEGTAKVFVNLLLCKAMEWKLSSFFRAIGAKKHGEQVKMQWDKVLGASGRAMFEPRTYTKDGKEKSVNDVKYFIDYKAPEKFAEITEPDSDLPF